MAFHLAFKNGDPTEARTRDTLIKSQVLCLLSYWVMIFCREAKIWLRWQDSNLRMPGSKPGALTNFATPHHRDKKIGEPTGIRTPDTRLRRPLLYPTEL